jgi:hypothetical protein
MLERMKVLEKTKRKGATNKGWPPSQPKTMEVRFAHTRGFNDKHGNKHGDTCGIERTYFKANEGAKRHTIFYVGHSPKLFL